METTVGQGGPPQGEAWTDLNLIPTERIQELVGVLGG